VYSVYITLLNSRLGGIVEGAWKAVFILLPTWGEIFSFRRRKREGKGKTRGK